MMKRSVIYMSVALSMLAVYSCNNTAKTDEAATDATTEMQNTEPKQVDIHLAQLASDQDFVCGMKITDEMIADTNDVDGKVYGFCSKECKAQFAQDPQKFLSQK